MEAVVARHFPEARLQATERLTGGVSADVHRLDLLLANGRACRAVLRARRAAKAGHGLVTEFHLLQWLQEAGVPVPQPIGVDTSGDLLEAPYLLMSFVEGSTAIPDDRANACIARIADTLAALHAMPVDALPMLPARRDPLPELLSFVPVAPEWHALRNHLSPLNNTAYEGTPVLLHGDFWPENLIWRDGRIVAILDWEDAAVGDPLSDVACTSLEVRYLYGTEGADHFREVYARHSAVEPQRFALWQAYVAAAAQRYMGSWGLAPSREAHMRRTALSSLREAGTVLMA